MFPGYAFVWIALQWHAAKWAPGVVRLVSSGGAEPAKVPTSVIDDLKARERDGYVVLPQPPGLKRGDKVQVIYGAFAGHLAVLEGMKPRARVEVLMTLLGTQRRAELPKRMCGRPDQQIAVCKRSEQRSGLAVSGRLKRAANHGQHHGYILGRSKFSCDLNDDSGRVSGHPRSSAL